jgi:hypothetical protein
VLRDRHAGAFILIGALAALMIVVALTLAVKM